MEEAVRSGNLGRVQELIQDGADVNACRKGMSLLSLAIKEGHKEIALELIHRGANVNASRKGTPLLSLAIQENRKEIALELIHRGANIHAQDRDWGRTALHWACQNAGRETVVERLVDRGCFVNAEDSMHLTPLSLTTEWCGVAAANHLLAAGADCKALSKRQMNVLFLPACWNGDVSVATTLLENGCDINARNQAGEPAIVLAAEIGREEIVKMLILAGANLDLQDHEDGYTALHRAAINNEIQCGVLLTEGGANVGIKDKHSRTAHDVARSDEFREAIKQALSFTVSKIVCILGNTGVGKSTLIAALQAERKSFIGRAWNRYIKRISDHRKRTAGIEPIHYHSQRYGEALFFDFAGQHEYHGPHQPFLESLLSKPGVPLTLLMMVKLTDGEEAIVEQLHYWLFPLVQMATTAANPPQIFVIGSFLDQVESNDAATAKLQRCIGETRAHLNGTVELKFMESCLLNCRQPQSEGIDKLCHFLREVSIPKLKAIHTSYSLAWVLSQIKLKFATQRAVQLHTLEQWIEENRDNLPQAIPSPEEVCKDLSAAGHALYLPDVSNWCKSWLVLDLASILHVVYGTLFSQPKETMNKFGLLHRQELARLFPQMSLEMIQQLLIGLEFCTPVDLTVLSEDVKKLTTSEEDSGWLFFPAFVSAVPPKAASGGHSQQSICSLWWQLRTCDRHFFFARVLQTILLHVAANFVVKHDHGDCQPQSCSFWWNGLTWQSKEGINVTVHITTTELHVIGASEETADRLQQYLMKVIDDILSTVHNVFPHLKAEKIFKTSLQPQALNSALTDQPKLAPSPNAPSRCHCTIS